MNAIVADNISLGYKDRTIIPKLSLSIPQGQVCTILGPNGSGKSTLLRSLARGLHPLKGTVHLHGQNLYSLRPRQAAKQIALLTQKPSAPEDLTVKDLVQYGRYPHRSWRGLTSEDQSIIAWALEQTNLVHYAHRKLQGLSGGEGQRAWLAMALAQRPKVLMLDEPTTFLDIRYQLELMELIQKIKQTLKITIVMVLHDLNQASRYSDRLIVMKDGAIYTDGKPREVIHQGMLQNVFGVTCELREDKLGNPLFDPIGITQMERME